MRAILGAGLMVFLSGAVFGQSTQPAFEVASVKPSLIGRAGGEGSRREKIDHTPGSLTMRNVSMKSCLQWAYDVKNFQVSGPGWLETERYDVAGKAADPAPEGQLRLMLQALLADRFKVTLHREEKVLPVYALVVGKSGPKFKESETEGDSAFQPGKSGKLSASAVRTSMAQLADLLSGPLRIPVIDQTGLKGRYDFNVDVAAYMASEAQMKEAQADPAAIVFAVLQEQLGLKLESKKSPVQMLVIDSAEKVPTEN
jgi:uncharacterized protein (TIGR03435 family)